MSDQPSWLNEDTVAVGAKVAKNPVVQKTATKFASNPAVQQAAKDAAKETVKESLFGKSKSSNERSSSSSEPSWAQPAASNSKDVESGAAQSSSAATGSDFEVDEATLGAMRRQHTILRVLYMTASAFLGLAAGLYLNNQSNPSSTTKSATTNTVGGSTGGQSVGTTDIGLTFFALYVLFFALMICVFEVGYSTCARMMAINFGFLYNIAARFIFMLYVGFMAFGFGPIGIAAMCWLYVVGIFHLIVVIRFPKFQEYVRRKDYYAISGGKQ